MSIDDFRTKLITELMKGEIETSRLDIFVNTILKILDKHAPIKKRYVRANEAPFMNKTLKKAIMKRSRLRNRYLNTKTVENKRAYNK